jgi:COMPASS component SWD3
MRILRQTLLILLACILLPCPSYITAQEGIELEDDIFITGGIGWHPDGERIAVGTNNGIWIHEANNLQNRAHFIEQPLVTTLSWSFSGQYIATGDLLGIIRIWDAEETELVISYSGHTDTIFDVGWTLNDEMLVSSGQDDQVTIWSISENQIITILEQPSCLGCIRSFDWNHERERLALNGFADLFIWELQTQELIQSWEFSPGIHAVSWQPNSDAIAVSDGTSGIQVIDGTTGEVITSLGGGDYGGAILNWNPSGTMLITDVLEGELNLERRRTMRVWDWNEANIIEEFPGVVINSGGYYANTLAWNPAGNRFAASSDDGRIYIWESNTFILIDIYDGYEPTRYVHP